VFSNLFIVCAKYLCALYCTYIRSFAPYETNTEQPRGEHLQYTSLVGRITFSFFVHVVAVRLYRRPSSRYFMFITICVIVPEFMHATSAVLCCANRVPKSECFRITYAIFDEGVPFFA
jgi:hypothetical protein